MASEGLRIKHISNDITTFAVPFNRFAPLGRSFPSFVAVGNRATAIRLHDGRILLLYPIKLDSEIQHALEELGGVHLIACDLGHHMYVTDYLKRWPAAKTIAVPGLPQKRADVKWKYIYRERQSKVEDVFDFSEDFETVLFEGFITYCVAWYHKPTRTLIQSDLLMDLPCTDQYLRSSASKGSGSWLFSRVAHPRSNWFRRLIFYIAVVDYSLMTRDAKLVSKWDIDRIVPCHGDLIENRAADAWEEAYQWFLSPDSSPGVYRFIIDHLRFMTLVRWIFLM